MASGVVGSLAEELEATLDMDAAADEVLGCCPGAVGGASADDAPEEAVKSKAAATAQVILMGLLDGMPGAGRLETLARDLLKHRDPELALLNAQALLAGCENQSINRALEGGI
jgi:hypothetical protein